MTRDDYLRDFHVKCFVAWLRPRVQGEVSFEHGYQMHKPQRDWRCCSLWEAYEGYVFGGGNDSDFWATQAKLDQLRCEIRAAERNRHNCRFITAALGIMKWGGVLGGNKKTLCGLGDRALCTFSHAARLLDPEQADTVGLGGVEYMNSGWTKVYSLMLDGFPMYDGRVGAAMGYLVRRYCEDQQLTEVPGLLRFRWHAGRSSKHLRNPSSESLEFLPLSFGRRGRRTWAECNVRTAWILGEVCDEGRFGKLAEAYRVRALEAALFMIGYELPGHDPCRP